MSRPTFKASHSLGKKKKTAKAATWVCPVWGKNKSKVKDQSISCDHCDQWICKVCSKLNAINMELVEGLTTKHKGCVWLCGNCEAMREGVGLVGKELLLGVETCEKQEFVKRRSYDNAIANINNKLEESKSKAEVVIGLKNNTISDLTDQLSDQTL